MKPGLSHYHAKYKGPLVYLRNRKALVRLAIDCEAIRTGAFVYVQFDDVALTVRHGNGRVEYLGYGWHLFRAAEFSRPLNGSGSGYSQAHKRCLDREWLLRVDRAVAARKAERQRQKQAALAVMYGMYKHHRDTPRVGTLPGEERR